MSAVEEAPSGFEGIHGNVEVTARGLSHLDQTVANVAATLNVVGKTLGDVFSNITQGLSENGDISAISAENIGNVFEALEKKNLTLSQLADCGGGKQGFNAFEWIVSSAYAKSGCSYTGEDGHVYELSLAEYENCLAVMAGGFRSKTDSADGDSIRLDEIAAALRNLDKRAGIGELSGTETLQAAGAFKQELIRAWLKSVGNEQLVSQYDNVTEAIAEGVSSFGTLLNKRLEETGKEKAGHRSK